MILVPYERQSEILKLLHEYRSVKILELSSHFGVTRETIRKDLYDMEEKGEVRKVHGGAILNKANHETNYESRKNINESEKREIAKKASEFVRDGDTIYVDYGTTVSYFIKEIMNKKNLTIITASMPLATELNDYTKFDIILIGGFIRKNEKSLFGPIAQRIIQDIYVDKGFFGTGGVDAKVGFTNFHQGESEISKLMINHSQKKVMMADYAKFDTVAMNKVASLSDIDILITDCKADKHLLEEIGEGVGEVITVKVEEAEDFEE
ncbi:DeoR/GlpR family DNA-binding transcription regulator [Lentibacillus salicampi]|uniref:DeoR/GlpR transcriptional regulator n=1 Tax=Lentibacillus salicampi TaxID=175306 RepID=A0A4Y9A7E3_9BACI|nr:DeoR/GlpR family DNA-binding transcription regulator [Lentibacillus salicampi]TFJ91678.1 DeoR/GlpR transcriptional regulator [Lentibacillus salicampi]